MANRFLFVAKAVLTRRAASVVPRDLCSTTVRLRGLLPGDSSRNSRA